MISIVIPAYNEEKNITNCLDAFLSQKTKRPFELILVDNSSTDRTAEIAKTYEGKLNIKIIADPVKGRGHARYTGFKNATGDIILSSDADAAVPKNWIENLVSTLESDSSTIAVTGTCQIMDCDEKTNRCFNYFQPLAMKLYRLFFGHYWLSGFSFGIRKEAYERSGGFNPTLNALEDIDLSAKVSKVGKIIFLPNTPIIFSGRRFKGGLVKGMWPYIKTFFSLRLKKKDVAMDDPR